MERTAVNATTSGAKAVYESPCLQRLGFFHIETQGTQPCFWDKKFGGFDGHTFDNENIPISNCS